jgi:hypothetical protein
VASIVGTVAADAGIGLPAPGGTIVGTVAGDLGITAPPPSGTPDATDRMLAMLTTQSPEAGMAATIAMGPDVRAAINKGAELAKDAAPVITMVNLATSGHEPSPAQVIAGISGVIGMINPLAGAVVFAMGTIMLGMQAAANGLFVSLGLQHVIHTNEVVIGGVIPSRHSTPAAPIVNADGSVYFDALWLHWESLIPVVGGGYVAMNRLTSETDLNTDIRPAADAPMWNIFWVLAPNRPGNFSPGYPEVLPQFPTPQNDFEKFFYPMLKKNMEHWYNANPYVPPRDLLDKARAVWNMLHSASPARTYVPNESNSDSIVSFIQSGKTDISGSGTRGAPVTINLGPMLPVPPAPVITLKLGVVPHLALASAPVSTRGPAPTAAQIAEVQAARVYTQKLLDARAAAAAPKASAFPWGWLALAGVAVGGAVAWKER